MTTPTEFDDIRPYNPEELPAVFNQLEADPMFKAEVTKVMPEVPFEVIMKKAKACKTLMDFQVAFSYDLMQRVMDKCTNGTDMNAGGLDKTRNYTFVSNHRDIVLDSGFLSKLLLDNHFSTTTEIAIGSNLLIFPWLKALVRLNKSFIVKRASQGRQKLLDSIQLSHYMHYVIQVKKDNIWIAQRQGRAKDSNDETQESILKMMCFGGEGSIIERLQQLHLVPLSISYEFDPCDFLKAKEFQQKRDNAQYQKSEDDDLQNMTTGIGGYKGHVHYKVSAPLDNWLSTLDLNMPKNDLFAIIAQHIDHEIHSNYRLYANNYIAYDMLSHAERFAELYTQTEQKRFEDYIHAQLAKIDLENPDMDYLEQMMLTMYANPLRAYLKAAETDKNK